MFIIVENFIFFFQISKYFEDFCPNPAQEGKANAYQPPGPLFIFTLIYTEVQANFSWSKWLLFQYFNRFQLGFSPSKQIPIGAIYTSLGILENLL